MNTYTPDYWVLVEFVSPEYGKIIKILASWYGGFADADYWKLSSGVASVRKDGDVYHVTNNSGSVYVVRDDASVYRMSGYATSVYEGFKQRINELEDGTSIRLLHYDDAIDCIKTVECVRNRDD